MLWHDNKAWDTGIAQNKEYHRKLYDNVCHYHIEQMEYSFFGLSYNQLFYTLKIQPMKINYSNKQQKLAIKQLPIKKL